MSKLIFYKLYALKLKIFQSEQFLAKLIIQEGYLTVQVNHFEAQIFVSFSLNTPKKAA
jgi:hypothetical protein